MASYPATCPPAAFSPSGRQGRWEGSPVGLLFGQLWSWSLGLLPPLLPNTRSSGNPVFAHSFIKICVLQGIVRGRCDSHVKSPRISVPDGLIETDITPRGGAGRPIQSDRDRRCIKNLFHLTYCMAWQGFPKLSTSPMVTSMKLAW